MRIFRGIDFANVADRCSQCWLTDDGSALEATFAAPQSTPNRTAVDCPFGTTAGFEALLRGEMPTNDHDDGFKTRATDRLLRQHIAAYKTNQDWRQREGKERRDRASYFNGGSHVQPTVGLQIVPAFLYWLGRELAPDAPREVRLRHLQEARLANGPVVEAHPRLFLYSAIERIRLIRGAPLDAAVQGRIASYKEKGDDGEVGRRDALGLLRCESSWQPAGQHRKLVVSDEKIIGNDHAFDAWLSALTAWAHDLGDTWTWREAGLEEARVRDEGHILVLRTSRAERT